MKPTTTRVLRLLAVILMLGAMLATSASPAGASSAKATAVAATSSHATVASMKAAAAQTLVAAPAKKKCTTFWCTHPNCHTYRCWFKYCHTWFCIHKHHMHPYGHPFVNRPPPKMMVKSTAFTQGGTLTLAVDDASNVRLALVGSNKKSVSLGSFSTAISTGLLSRAVKLPAGLSGAYTLVATDAVSHESSTMPVFIAASKLKAAPATKLASAQTSSSNVGFSMAAVIGVGVLAIAMLGSGSTMLLLGRRRRTWKARA